MKRFAVTVLAMLSLSGTVAVADIRALTDGCFKVFEANDAKAFPYKIKRIATGPDQYQQGYKTNLGTASVTMVINPDPNNPINFSCQVDGAEMRGLLKAKRITVRWPEAEAQMNAAFKSYAKKAGFRVIVGRLREDSLGVESMTLVKCAKPSALLTFGPSRLSDAGFLQPPFALNALGEATFSVGLSSPLIVPMRNKHCK